MAKSELTDKEKLTLYGLVRYPNYTDKQLSQKLNIKHSTITAIRRRLKENGYYKKLIIPRLQNLGSKMLVIIYTDFSPLIPLQERVRISGKTIAVFEEIFFSVGEIDKGFSLSLSKDYATIGRINDIRTRTFGSRGLLENEYPNMIVFPFEISKVYRFFDFAPLLQKSFELDLPQDEKIKNISFLNEKPSYLHKSESKVYCGITQYPEESDLSIGKILNVSRHTVSKMRRSFEQRFLIRNINLPIIKKLGFEILTFFHIRFDPSNPPDMKKDDVAKLMSNSTILLASRMFEAFMISIHTDFDDFKKDSTRINQILKENKWIAENPIIRTHSVSEIVFIKDFVFAPIAKKTLGVNL